MKDRCDIAILPPVPQPAVSLTNASVMAGSDATLQCSVTLNQYSSYADGTVAVTVELLNSTDTAVATMLASGSGATRTANFTVSTVDVSEAGQYRCRATVAYTGTNDQYVEEPSATDSPSAFLTLQSKHVFLCQPPPTILYYIL